MGDKLLVNYKNLQKLLVGRKITVLCGCVYFDVAASRFRKNCLSKSPDLWFQVNVSLSYIYVDKIVQRKEYLTENLKMR